jgi:hypothetical protein
MYDHPRDLPSDRETQSTGSPRLFCVPPPTRPSTSGKVISFPAIRKAFECLRGSRKVDTPQPKPFIVDKPTWPAA